jgi:ABC-2 type transport system ATP-binding protein
MPEKAIQIIELSKSYKQFTALDRVTFDVEAGAFFGFLGPNGAGKTTTINIITGLANASHGQVLVFGQDVIRDYRKARALIGLVPQEFNFDPFLTAEQILIFEGGYFSLPKKEAVARAAELMEQFNLTAYKHLDSRKLSGGLKRRLLIARALMHKPRILILDEPTAGVDLDLRYKLWDFFKEINKKGITIFLTTHYIEEAEVLCNRIGVIHQGKMVAVEDKQKLLQQLSRNMIEIQLDRTIDKLPLGLEKLGVEPASGSDRIRLKEEDRNLSELLKAIHACGMEVLDVQVIKPSLEDVFFSLTQNENSESDRF